MTSSIDAGLVGRRLRPVRWAWEPSAAILYALGVGATVARDLSFLYEAKGPLVLPTFGAVPTGLAFMGTVEELGLDLRTVLHAGQRLTIHRPLAASGVATVSRRIVNVWDKGSGAIVVIEETAADDEPLLTGHSSWWVGGAGGFGGERGPSGGSSFDPPARSPDLTLPRTVGLDQAALYRLSGDLNPIHIDPDFARRAGVPSPFLHGLCTFGIVGLELVAALWADCPQRLRGLDMRFAAPVWPGDELAIEVWVDPEDALLRVMAGERRLIASGGGRFVA